MEGGGRGRGRGVRLPTDTAQPPAAGRGRGVAPPQDAGADAVQRGGAFADDAREQNVRMMRRMKQLLRGNEEHFAQLRLQSSEFLKGTSTVDEYYSNLQIWFGEKVGDILTDLLDLLPDAQRREALRLKYFSSTMEGPVSATAVELPPPQRRPAAVAAGGEEAGAGAWAEVVRQRRQ
eukprot:TRINITY_DN9223_c0_g1_i1.p2 TRINITY_DN9223_c0_g1~~TRINITY_DN9223_c0_g1_i1.p2  ORF type:complete len:177 (+),score=66.08 TRINITY_DN9223_c0_g1_i1:103-633(+)